MKQYILPKKIGFLTGYFLKKNLLGIVSDEDSFKRHLFRLRRKLDFELFVNEQGEYRFEIEVNNKKLSLLTRGPGSSDLKVLDQVFSKKEYQPLISLIQKMNQDESIQLIVDAGCNVGFASIYFKAFFPSADLIAIEAANSNKLLADKNFALNKLERSKLINAGVWSRNAFLEIKNDFRDGKEWSYYVTESDAPTNLQGMSLASILTGSGKEIIDLLKIDIEGGERELFREPETMDEILQKTRFLAIEIHDGNGIRKIIYESLKRNGFEWFDHEETTFAVNKKFN